MVEHRLEGFERDEFAPGDRRFQAWCSCYDPAEDGGGFRGWGATKIDAINEVIEHIISPTPGIAEFGAAVASDIETELRAAEAEKAAAEAYPDAYATSRSLRREAFIAGARWHASRLSPPTREELARFIEFLQHPLHHDQVGPDALDEWYLADAILARFSLSAPETKEKQ